MKELKNIKSENNSSEYINNEINDAEYHDRLSEIVRNAVEQNKKDDISNNTKVSERDTIKRDDDSQQNRTALDTVNEMMNGKDQKFISYKLALSREYRLMQIVDQLRQTRYSEPMTSAFFTWGYTEADKSTNMLLKSTNSLLSATIKQFENKLNETHNATISKFKEFLDSHDSEYYTRSW